MKKSDMGKKEMTDDISWFVADLARTVMETFYKRGLPLESFEPSKIADQTNRLLKGTAGELDVAKFLRSHGWQVIGLKPFIGPSRETFPDLLIHKGASATAFVEVKKVAVGADKSIKFSKKQLKCEYDLAKYLGIPLILAFIDKNSGEWRFSRIVVAGGIDDYPIIVGTVTRELESMESTWIGDSTKRFSIDKLEGEVAFGRIKELLSLLWSVQNQLKEPKFRMDWCEKAGNAILFHLGLAIAQRKKKTNLGDLQTLLKRAEEYLKSYKREIEKEF